MLVFGGSMTPLYHLFSALCRVEFAPFINAWLKPMNEWHQFQQLTSIMKLSITRTINDSSTFSRETQTFILSTIFDHGFEATRIPNYTSNFATKLHPIRLWPPKLRFVFIWTPKNLLKTPNLMEVWLDVYLEDHPMTCRWLITMVIVSPQFLGYSAYINGL